VPYNTADLSIEHSGSVCVKAAHRTLMKLTPGWHLQLKMVAKKQNMSFAAGSQACQTNESR